MELEWSPLAVQRVVEIAKYIAMDKPTVANDWAIEIFDFVEKLIDFPQLGRVVPEINDENYREIIKGNYRIIYRVGLNNISILTVRHGKQILPIDELK
jgi:plasmid stabilization system protein ParE